MHILPFLLIISFAWQQSGPEGGYFKDFAVAPGSPGVIYAGSDDSGGLWRTSDGGSSWELLTSQWPDMTAWEIVMQPGDPSVMYICDPYGRYGLLKSTDSGVTWQQAVGGLTGISERMISGLVIVPDDPDSLYISTGLDRYGDPPKPGNGVFVSSDGGINWSPSGLQGSTILCIARTGSGTLFAGVEDGGLMTSTDGSQWSQVPEIPADASVWQVEASNEVVAAGCNPYGVYLSFDGGQSFQLSLSNLYTADLCISRTIPEPEIYACTFPGFARYTPSEGWTDRVSPPLPDSLMIMGVSAVGDSVICGAFCNGPVYLSTDKGESWKTLQSSPVSAYITGIAVVGETIYAANMGSYMDSLNTSCIWRSDDGGGSWTREGPAAHALFVQRSGSVPGKVFTGTFGNGAFVSSDGFETWESLRDGNRIVFHVMDNMNDPLQILCSEWNLATSEFGIYRSSDGGAGFQHMESVIVSQFMQAENTDLVLAATPDGILASPDFGVNWTGQVLSGYNVRSLEQNEGTFYAGTATGELFSLDQVSAEDISGPWERPVEVEGLLFSNGVLYAGLNGAEVDTSMVMNGGVWATSDQGTTWTELTDGMTVDHVYGNNPITTCGGALTVSTYGGGIQMLQLEQGVEHPQPEPLTISPNPCSGQFVMTSCPAGEATLSVMDLSGRTVLESAVTPDPYDNIVWSLDELPSGIYMVNITGDGFGLRSGKLVLLTP